MNIAILSGLALTGFLVLWLVQTGLLIAAGQPWHCGLLRHRCDKPLVRLGMKFALQGVLLTLLFGYPAAIGENPIDYHLARLQPANWYLLGAIVLTTVLSFCLPLAFNCSVGWVKVEPQPETARVVRRVVRRLLTPLPLAFVEEALFRGVILDAMLRSLSGPEGMVLAIALSAAVFASVHFFRPQKRVLLPVFGLFVLGVVLGTAYVLGGYSYWLPVGMHAGGVLFIQVSRQFVRYHGPAWLIGYSSYPICGAFGVVVMATYTAALAFCVNAGVV